MAITPPLGNQSVPENQIGAAVTLDYVVAELLNEYQDYGTAQKDRLMGLCISVLRDIRLYNQALIQVGYFEPNEAGIIPFPKDYLDYTLIGVPRNGQMHTLTLNNNMLLNRAKVCAEDSRTPSNNGVVNSGVGDGFYYPGAWSNGNYYPPMYGVGGGKNMGYYKIDKAAQQIQFDGRWAPMICMVYKSTGISPNTVIGPECVNPLKEGVHFLKIKRDPRVSLGEKAFAKKEYEEAVSKLRAFVQKFTIAEYLDIMRQSRKQSPKP